MSSENPKISVIIPHHQGKDLILGCLASLERQTTSNSEIIVVDNGSRDGSIESVTQALPKVRVIRLAANEGFAYAANLGARESRGDIIAFLNDDAEAEPSWIEIGVSQFDRHAEVGILACRMMDFHQREVVQNAGIKIHRCGRPSGRGRGYKCGDQWANEKEVFGASGGAMMVRRLVWEKVGPFREDFVSYLEDVDWAFRARLLGEKCLYVPDMVVYHREASTRDATSKTGVDSPERVRLIARNKLWVLWLNTPWQLLLLHFPFILGGWFYSFGHHLFRSGQIIPFLLGTLEGKWGIFPRWKERRILQKKRVIAIRELRHWYN
jgi:hypothetical protein